MVIPRFHVVGTIAANATLALPEKVAHHAAHVLRLRVGDAVVLFNGDGGEFRATVSAIGKRAVTVAVGAHDPVERESPLDVTLVQALSSGDRMDLTLQKAVELGVRRLVPVESERCVVRLKGERADKRMDHWRQVVIAACEQCGRNRVPALQPLVSLDVWLGAVQPGAARWVLLPGADMPLRDLPRPAGSVEILVGPEGGLTDAEAAAAQRAGYRALRLGPRVLRTETAAPALLAAMQALWGDF